MGLDEMRGASSSDCSSGVWSAGSASASLVVDGFWDRGVRVWGLRHGESLRVGLGAKKRYYNANMKNGW